MTPYAALNPGPYPQDQPKKNGVRFTPTQTEAIRSGMSKGLTLVINVCNVLFFNMAVTSFRVSYVKVV